MTKEFKARQELRFDLLGHGLIAPSPHDYRLAVKNWLVN